MKGNIITFLSVILFGSPLWASDTIPLSRTWVMGIPQHLINNGIRIDVDRQLASADKWITISPVVYYRGKEANFNLGRGSFKSMQGAGLGIYYRYFPGAMRKSFNFYLMAGGGYEFLSFKVKGVNWLPVEIDGLEYYSPSDAGYFNSHLHTFDIEATLGFKWLMGEHLAIDIFAGPGIGYSFTGGGNNQLFRDYDGYARYGKNGIGVAGGIRIGVGW